MNLKRGLLLAAGFVLIVAGATFLLAPVGMGLLLSGTGITAQQTYEYTQELRQARREENKRLRAKYRATQRERAAPVPEFRIATPTFEEDPLAGLVEVGATSVGSSERAKEPRAPPSGTQEAGTSIVQQLGR